jgi:hypothetical protein
VRARQLHGGVDAHGDWHRQFCALALSALELHQNRRKSLRQIVVNVARDPVALFENALTAFFASIVLDTLL